MSCPENRRALSASIAIYCLTLLAGACGDRPAVGPDGGQPTASWEAVGGATLGVFSHTATRLQDGTVIIAGGYDEGAKGKWLPVSHAHRYDPKTNRITPIANMKTPRGGHVAIRLKDGKVLVHGGNGRTGNNYDDLFAPQSGVWSSGPYSEFHPTSGTIIRVASGKILMIDGSGKDNDRRWCSWAVDQYEYKPGDPGRWSHPFAVKPRRCLMSATLLDSDRILLAGGSDYWTENLSRLLQVLDPASGKVETLKAGLLRPRFYQKTVRLSDGRVLLTGGYYTKMNTSNPNPMDHINEWRFEDSMEIFDPASGQTRMASLGGMGTVGHTVTKMPDGAVLFIGGADATSSYGHTRAALYHPQRGWRQLKDMPQARIGHTATLLADGSVLIAGGGATGKERIKTQALRLVLR